MTKGKKIITFSVELAQRAAQPKSGLRVMTRDGRAARIICMDRNSESYPIVALVGVSNEDVIVYREDGSRLPGKETGLDLTIVRYE